MSTASSDNYTFNTEKEDVIYESPFIDTMCEEPDMTKISDDEKNIKRGISCIEAGHGRTMEFVDVHMIIDGFSARVMREYYRHVGGLHIKRR